MRHPIARAPAEHLARAQELSHDLGHGHDPEAVAPLPQVYLLLVELGQFDC